MSFDKPEDNPVWKKLIHLADTFKHPEKRLNRLIVEPERIERFSLTDTEIFYDFSRQRVDDEVMALLFELAETSQSRGFFNDMMNGKIVNTTEQRAALHTSMRSFSKDSVWLDGSDVMPDIRQVRDGIKDFTGKIRDGKIKGSTGKSFVHVVVVGIGGSYLGTEFVSTALTAFSDNRFKLHYLSNVDIHNFGKIASAIDPETTLWIIISKSFTTAETMANATQAREFMAAQGLDPNKHFITVASKGSPGDDPQNRHLDSFHMFDFIGGRYSVTSAVGGVPLSIYLGYDIFERFLKGAEAMDIHTSEATSEQNIPLVAALISIWNHRFLGYKSQAIIPYASPLSKLATHIQQLHMESNGKSVTRNGILLDEPAGMIIFGEPGTNAQHSFFQQAHQGLPFPIDFIGVIHPQYTEYRSRSLGVTNHQELWSNLIAQADALAVGKEDTNAAKQFTGNRPSSTIIIKDLSPENIGRLLAFYEAKTVYEATLWGINPFDQFGVELGKTTASVIRKEMAIKNEALEYNFEGLDPIQTRYLKMLFNGKIDSN